MSVYQLGGALFHHHLHSHNAISFYARCVESCNKKRNYNIYITILKKNKENDFLVGLVVHEVACPNGIKRVQNHTYTFSTTLALQGNTSVLWSRHLYAPFQNEHQPSI